MANCNIHPIIISRGREVKSKLWTDLLAISNNREWAKRVYQGVHSDWFVKRFGDWITEAENTSLAVDEYGEPKVITMVYDSGETAPIFLIAKDETIYNELVNNNYEVSEGDLIPASYLIIQDHTGGEVNINEQRGVHPDPRVQAALKEKGPNIINNRVNPLVWDKEEELGVVQGGAIWKTDKFSGIPFRPKNAFSRLKAQRIADRATKDGYPSTIVQANTSRGKANKYHVNITYDISQETSAHIRLLARGAKFGEVRADLKERFPAAFITRENMTDLEVLHSKVTAAFNKRIAIMERDYDFISRQDFKEFLDDYLENNNVTKALVDAVIYSAKVTEQLYDRYKALQESGEKLTPRTLQTWSDFLIAYDALDELQSLMLKDPSIMQNESITKALDATIKTKNFLKSLYQTEGIDMLAKWLSPYYNGIRKKFEQKKRAEYRREYKKKEKGKEHRKDVVSVTEAEYVENKMSFQKGSLDFETEDLMKKELVTASRDISVLTRWIDNMLDTSDPVAAAVVNAFTQAEQQSRLESIKKRTEIIKEQIEFEKNRPKGNLTSEISYYSFALEFDLQGVATQWLLRPWRSDLIAEDARQRKRIFKEGAEEDPDTLSRMESDIKVGLKTKEGVRATRRQNMAIALSSWRNSNLNTDRDAYQIAGVEYMQSLVDKTDPITDQVVVTQDMIEKIKNNIEYNYNETPRKLAERGDISVEAAGLYSTWLSSNLYKFSDVIDTWKNPQWETFMKRIGISTKIPYYQQEDLMRQSEHPEAKYYMYILDLSIEADKKVPYSYRLGGRLPGVPKIQSERIKEGQDPLLITKNTFKAEFLLRPEDTERGDEILTDEQGRPRMFLPIHYVNNIELENQSFDLPGIYFRFWESANDYNIKRQILPEIEMAKFFIDTRNAKKRNSLDQFVMSKLNIKSKGNIDELEEDQAEGVPSMIAKTQIAEQFSDWFEMAVYSKKAKPGSLWHIREDLVIDTAKFVDAMNRYTSLSLLAFNMVQGAANVLIGETMQAIDAFAKEHVTAKSLTKATLRYNKWLPGMMGDWGMRVPTNVGSLLIEQANILHSSVTDVDFSKKTKVGQHFDLSTGFMIQKAGEHWMQGRFYFALLEEKQAYDKDGNHLGSMLDQYHAEDGVLILNKEVSLEKSKWTTSEQTAFNVRAKGLLSRMHGEYSDLGRVAIQRLAVGRMAYMFRKFVVPGYRRRWGKTRYIERLGQEVEGDYVSMIKFMKNMSKDLKIFKTAMMSEEWAALNDHERANIRRAIGETIAIISTSVAAMFLYKGLAEDDEDDWLLGYWAYQAYRLQTELLFWTPKLDEAMTILRSPAASMTVIENTIKLIDQMFSPMEQYERGPWKGQYKISKTLINFVPIWKQWYKARDVEETIQWFK